MVARAGLAGAYTQGFQADLPELAGEHRFVVGADELGEAESADGDEQVAQQFQRCLAHQKPRAKQESRTMVDDAQHSADLTIAQRIGGEVQTPCVVGWYAGWSSSLPSASELCNLGCVLLDEVGHPRLAYAGPSDMASVEATGDGAAAREM